LTTFETDRDLFASLTHLIPAGTIKVAESAVRNVDDVRHYRNAGADVVLVGEALVTGNPAELLSQFRAI
jgi:indole-3-glycerol phosphate synthase